MSRPKGKTAHPLWVTWREQLRAGKNDPHGIDERWQDFYLFIQDVGERPDGMVMYRLDRTKPYGPTNWQWMSKWNVMQRNLGGQAFKMMNKPSAKPTAANVAKGTALFASIKRTA